jgi:mono/diheme cytochrome c family protein
VAIAALLATTTGLGCRGGARGRDKAEEARALYGLRCATCHGDHGRGDGPAASALGVRPRDFTDATWQAQTSDDAIRRVILLGGAAVGKSPLMTANRDLESEPELLDSLVAEVRRFGAAARAP